jgi:hypothetical protein
MTLKRYESITKNFQKMKKEQIKKASEFLGVKKLTPLENKAIRGGKTVHQDQHIDQGSTHHHVQHHAALQ